MTEPPMVERIPDILQRLASLETDIKRSDQLLKSSVDDIKATIKSEISDLKGEQIGDLKSANANLIERLDRQAERMERIERSASERIERLERTQGEWKTGAGVAEWMIRFAILLIGVIITGLGVFGYKHIGAGS